MLSTMVIIILKIFQTQYHYIKKQSNTLYTINALNEVIRELNGGVLDKRFPIPWDDYYNSLLLTNENGLNKIPTKIHSIVDTKNYKEK